MTETPKIGGIIVPLVTPFDANGDLAVEKARCLIEKHLEIGVHGFYVGGSSGEGFFQSVDERREYLRFVAEVVGDRGLLIAQVGALSSRDVHVLAKFAGETGYDVISSTPPFYFTHTDAEVVEYYRELADVSDLPVLLYNIPATTGRSLSTAAQVEMLKLPNVVGSKHTDMNFFSAERLLREVPSAAIFNGPDEMLTGGLAMGMVGGIGSTYNLMPRVYLEIYSSVASGDIARSYLTFLQALYRASSMA
jgi:N-acetylneuraminate lyase